MRNTFRRSAPTTHNPAESSSAAAAFSSLSYPSLMVATSSSPTAMASAKPSILWSAVLRDDVILVEADVGLETQYELDEASRLLLAKKPTPGWEHMSFKPRREGCLRLKGTKFHIYEHNDSDDENVVVGSGGGTSNSSKHRNNGLIVWTVACVYDPSLVDEYQVKAFIEKIVTMTEVFRQPAVDVDVKVVDMADMTDVHKRTDFDDGVPSQSPFSLQTTSSQEDLWRYGSRHAVQSSFAPVLLQRMEEVSYLGKLAMCHERLDALKDVMARNIELILDQEERLATVTGQKAQECNDMARAFRKNTRNVKRQMMWNNAKHGVMLGTAITAGVATVVTPILVAVL